MKREDLDAIWQRPENYIYFPGTKVPLIYRSKDDPRIFVPKKSFKIGGTINFAHPFAWPALFICLVSPVMPIIFAYFLNIRSPMVFLAMVVVSMGGLLLWAYYDSNHRHID